MIHAFKTPWYLYGGAAALVLLLLGPMLTPGYVLTLDMVWVPEPTLPAASERIDSLLPVQAFFVGLAHIAPSWVAQKLMLTALFFLLFFMPLRYLPFLEGMVPRLFAAGIYALNPFVYARMLAGQWPLLFAYALLPFLLFALEQFVGRPSAFRAYKVGVALSLIAIFSVHLAYLGIVVSLAWVGVHLVIHRAPRALLSGVFIAAGVFLVASSFWFWPALMREAPLEARFDEAHFSAFAASANRTLAGETPLFLNLALLGGFWGEDTLWSEYFAWPQNSRIFLAAATLAALLIATGVVASVRARATRRKTLLLLALGLAPYVLALGGAETPLRPLVLYIYEWVPGYSGLRDSHKLIAYVAPIYAIFGGLGVAALLRSMPAGVAPWRPLMAGVLLSIPLACGIYMWGGWRGQLEPVFYPPEWEEAKRLLDNAGGRAIVLPWHGYFSLDFANQLIVANPAPAYFGDDRVIAGKSVEAEGLLSQEADPAYQRVDEAVRTLKDDPRAMRHVLKADGVAYLLIIRNSDAASAADWTFGSLEDDAPENDSSSLEQLGGSSLIDGAIVLKKLETL